MSKEKAKENFERALKKFVAELSDYASLADGQWSVKGFIDAYKNVYTISADTKIVSKILEIHLFPMILRFAEENGYVVVPTDHQNYYPDISFVNVADSSLRFAVDFKTTYNLPDHPGFCNGFTLGSHGEYFTTRTSTKNIQFPYNTYSGHFCLGIIYNRAGASKIDETKIFKLDELESITSVIKDIRFFVVEKWKIASDRPGSGNTANIGSIDCIEDIVAGRGIFADLGEAMFDEYWMNFNKIKVIDTGTGVEKTIRKLEDYLHHKGMSSEAIVARKKRRKQVLPEEEKNEDSGSSD